MGFNAQFLVIGHRGAAGLVPENTLPSFARAADLGVDAVELDVHVCDGELCVIHDATLDRTTNGHGPLAARTLAELRALDAGGGARIPLLDEVFEALPENVGVNVELKGPGTGARLAKHLGAGGREVLVSAFDHEELATFKGARPELEVAPLFGRWRNDPLAVAAAFGSRFIHLSRRIVTAERIDAINKAGLAALIYTVNDVEEADRLKMLGVRGLFTDYPDRIRPIVRAD